MKTLLRHLRDPKYIGQEGMRLQAADEIERLQEMCIRREDFIAQQNLWAEFSKWLSVPDGDNQQSGKTDAS